MTGKLFRYIVATVLLLGSAAFRADGFEPLPARLDGSMMIYDFAACDSSKAWPDSLRPVYTAYVARHGARLMTSGAKLEKMQRLLYDATRSRKITSAGIHFAELVRKMTEAGAGKWGLLSPVGIEEERRLAREMAALTPGLFAKGDVRAISTYVPRVIMTMYQFMHSLEAGHTGLNIFTGSGKTFSPYLRCFQTDSVYRDYRGSGDWRAVYEEYSRRWIPTAPARRILGASLDNDSEKLRDITMTMYDIMQACRAAGLPAPTTEFMTVDEYSRCWLAENLEHYLRNSVTPLSTACAAATAPLIKRIIKDADEELLSRRDSSANPAKGPVVLNGYFGHAETLLPLFATLDIEGCFALPLDYADLAKHWKVQDITPLGANLALILLRGDSGAIYASLRLNGRNIRPLRDSGYVVKWSDLKDFWLRRLRLLRPQDPSPSVN